MNLFNSDIDTSRNLLPKDGTVNYYGKLLLKEKANHFYDVHGRSCLNGHEIYYNRKSKKNVSNNF